MIHNLNIKNSTLTDELNGLIASNLHSKQQADNRFKAELQKNSSLQEKNTQLQLKLDNSLWNNQSQML